MQGIGFVQIAEHHMDPIAGQAFGTVSRTYQAGRFDSLLHGHSGCSQADIAAADHEQAKREKKEALERRFRDARRVAEDANRDFEKKVREAEMETTREIFTVIQEYGKDQGFSVVFERSSIIFGAATVDVTADIIKRYDGKAAK